MRTLVVCLAATLLLCSTGVRALPQRSASVTVGELVVGYEPSKGLSIRYRGESVVEGATALFHDGSWKRICCAMPTDVRDVQVTDTPDGKALRVVGGPADESFSLDYVVTARRDNSVSIQLSYTPKRQQPLALEYAAVQMSEAPIVGCAYTAREPGGVREGKAPLEAATADINEQTWVTSGASELTIRSRVGTVTLTTGGDPWFCLFDARLRFNGSRLTGTFWGGRLSEGAPAVGETRHLDLTIRFAGDAARPGAALDVAGKGAAPAVVRSVSRPTKPAAGLPALIPDPKEARAGTGVFSISRTTPIVVRDNAAPEDLRAARDLNRELQERFRLQLPVRQARQAKPGQAAIVLGEPEANPLVARAAAQSQRATAPEGYLLSVGPKGIVVCGRDRAGTYWGVQTLLQLLRSGAKGPEAPAVTVRDWPDFGLRAAHLGIGEHDLGLVRRIVERVLPRYKMNAVVLEMESIRWDSHPEWAPKGPTPAQVGEVAQAAREHFVEPIPQIQSGGHCEYWLFRDGIHRELAEVPERPYNYCPSNPEVYRILFDLYAEVQKHIHPRYFHIGHDELNNEYGVCPLCKGKSPAELFAGDVKKLRDWWAERGVPIMIWSDMLLAPVDAPGGTDAFNGGGALNVSQAVPLLPKDVIIADWHYGGNYEKFVSQEFWEAQGFKTVVGPWNGLSNIWNIARDGLKHHSMGVIGTTWCGVASEEQALGESFQYLGPLVYTADCAWSVGRRAPEKLPYEPGERFVTALSTSTMVPSTGAGFLVDLSAAGTRALADAGGEGWLGYGAGRDLAGVPTGRVSLGDNRFLVAPKAVALAGTLAPAGLPASVSGIAIGRKAKELLFVHTCGWGVAIGERVGSYRIHYADGSTEEAPLIYGRNITCALDARPLSQARRVWEGKTPGGAPLALTCWPWKNPHPERAIASVDFESAGRRAAPALIALTGVSP